MGINTFSALSSILGFLAAAISIATFLIDICRSNLPSNKIKELECLMNETDTLFKKAVEDGLLIEPELVRQTERQLIVLRTITYQLQSRAHNVTTFYQDYLEFLKGTSQLIGSTCHSLRELRAQVVTYREKRFHELTANSVLQSISPPTPPLAPSPNDHSSPLPPVQIARPSSCPPILSGWRMRHGFARGNPSCDFVRGGSDVRATDAQTRESITHTSATLEPGA